jgi:hypothetical protein
MKSLAPTCDALITTQPEPTAEQTQNDIDITCQKPKATGRIDVVSDALG